ncbi:MAG: HemK2/MTQ2 family protein methyltransferase [Promethearchaeota archaeon]
MSSLNLDEKNSIIYQNLKFVVPKQVYSPSDDTDLSIFFLKKWMENLEKSPFGKSNTRQIHIYDMGIGSGVLSLYLASRLQKKGFLPHIWGVDINPIAVETANFNAKINNLQDFVTFYHGTYFNPLQTNQIPEKFDLIISNPPYLAGEPKIINESNRQWIDYAWEGGINGYEVTLEFLQDISGYLATPGDLMLISSSNIDQKPILSRFKDLKIRIIDTLKTHVFFEDILLYHGRRDNI